ncbi:hypothetical protein AB0I10_29935 [Streptomyces sp. NPDC050636]|uniref:hypothetical protein n=1 Tax=Streptomyces sp. NPDC050636 TaxID=3154510 RepID=UPI00341C627F
MGVDSGPGARQSITLARSGAGKSCLTGLKLLQLLPLLFTGTEAMMIVANGAAWSTAGPP